MKHLNLKNLLLTDIAIYWLQTRKRESERYSRSTIILRERERVIQPIDIKFERERFSRSKISLRVRKHTD